MLSVAIMDTDEEHLAVLLAHRDILAVIVANEMKRSPRPLEALRKFSALFDILTDHADEETQKHALDLLERYRAEVDFVVSRARTLIEGAAT